MRLAPAVVDVEVRHGQAGAGQALDGPRVRHHGGVDAVEGAALEHEHLAAAALFGGCPEDAHGQAEVVGHRGQGQAGAHGHGGDDVVSAGVTHLG